MPRFFASAGLGRALDGHDALSCRGQHLRRGELIGDAAGKTNAIEAGARHDQRIRRPDRAAFRHRSLLTPSRLAD